MTAEIEKASIAFPEYNGESWEILQSSALTVAGADLEAGDQLIGVPFTTIAVTFRPGDFAGHDGIKHDYVSIELVTGDDAAFAKARKRNRIPADVEVEPGEVLVINEAGTGLRRNIVAAMEHLGWISLPAGPADGAFRESRFDQDFWEWELPAGSPVVRGFGKDGLPRMESLPLRLYAPRGLRVSEYENDYTKTGRTRYFA